MKSIKLPTLLGGPIIRRADTHQVTIWLATSQPLEIKGKVFKVTNGRETETNEYEMLDSYTKTDTIRAGSRLFIHLLSISPHTGTFPAGTLIGYNLSFADGNTCGIKRIRC
ncbi:hypothetical protein D3H55_13520 [Bacillus salacetis]|uniref:Uncharacterized protein n=1 Tax=Bacillus salacetis TaxID=2315464 RepID=A0A3A1QYB9_9BACI|nr:hypothetical protein [Bacillus salacetis]RIW32290.1 hypothetical protein D3H55_13520 [Bacillus salacetis]